MYIIHYHMVILVSQEAWCHHSWLLNLQVTISHINHEWMRPILLKYKLCYNLNIEYCLGSWPGHCLEKLGPWPWHCLTSLFWILTLTISWETSFSQLPYVTLITKQTSLLNSHWTMVPDDIQLTLYIFGSIATYGYSNQIMDITVEFTPKMVPDDIQHLWHCI